MPEPDSIRVKCYDAERFRYQRFLSDVAGQDIKAHDRDPRKTVRAIRDWLRTTCGQRNLPGGAAIWKDYLVFQQDLPNLLRRLKLSDEEITFVDYGTCVTDWLRNQAEHGELRE